MRLIYKKVMSKKLMRISIKYFFFLSILKQTYKEINPY